MYGCPENRNRLGISASIHKHMHKTPEKLSGLFEEKKNRFEDSWPLN